MVGVEGAAATNLLLPSYHICGLCICVKYGQLVI